MERRREAGFSLVELITVCVVLVIISAIAVPQMMQSVTNYRLNSAGRAVSGLLQQARLQAVQTNRPAYAQVDTKQTPNMAFMNADQSGYVPGTPSVAISTYVTYATGTPPTHDQLDTFVGGTSGAASVSLQPPGAIVGFNARGLPCVGTSANPLACSAIVGGKPVAFEWFFQNSSGGWVAVTVTPAGRIKSWRLATQSSSGGWQ